MISPLERARLLDAEMQLQRAWLELNLRDLSDAVRESPWAKLQRTEARDRWELSLLKHRSLWIAGSQPADQPLPAPCATRRNHERESHAITRRRRTRRSCPISSALRERAREQIMKGAVTPSFPEADRSAIVELLNTALATEIVCVLRYKRHYFATHGIRAKFVSAEFLEHANEEQAHADQIAERIVQLGEDPDLNPATLLSRSHSEYDESTCLRADARGRPHRRAHRHRELS